jgi:hypothetical protein
MGFKPRAQGPSLRGAPNPMFFVNVLNKSNNSLETFYGFIKWKMPKVLAAIIMLEKHSGL